MWKRISFQLEAVDVTIDCNFLILFDRRKFEKKRFDIRSVGEYFGMEEQKAFERLSFFHGSQIQPVAKRPEEIRTRNGANRQVVDPTQTSAKNWARKNIGRECGIEKIFRFRVAISRGKEKKKKKEERGITINVRAEKDDDWRKKWISWLDKNANAATFASTLSVTFTENQQNFIYFISNQWIL